MAIARLLLAVLAMGLVPHVHALDTRGAPGIEAASQDGGPAASGLSADECVACRSGHGSRLAITPPRATALLPPSAGATLRAPNEVQVLAARRIASPAPPRAPPV